MEGVKGLAEFSIHNYDLEGPAEISKENIYVIISSFDNRHFQMHSNSVW